MEGIAIGDVCKLLRLKPHVLRYWEREIPMLSPRKDRFGRRMYSEADMELLSRIRHLLYEKKFTVAGVKNRIWEEIGGGQQNLRASTLALRSELLKLLRLSEKLRSKLEEANESREIESL